MKDSELDIGFTALLAATPMPHRMFRCYARYRYPTGTTDFTSGNMPGETSDSALAAFLTEADEEFGECHRVDQGARVL